MASMAEDTLTPQAPLALLSRLLVMKGKEIVKVFKFLETAGFIALDCLLTLCG